jgi:hypothetical protein
MILEYKPNEMTYAGICDFSRLFTFGDILYDGRLGQIFQPGQKKISPPGKRTYQESEIILTQTGISVQFPRH